MNPGGGGCNEPRLHHCIPAWVTKVKLCLKKKKEKKERERRGEERRRKTRRGEERRTHDLIEEKTVR